MAQKKRLGTKIAAVALAASVLVGGGTFAYLQASTDEVENQFNPNTVYVSLTETTGSTYEVIPGTSVEKDPTVTVNATVPAWVFVTVQDDTVGIADWAVASGWTVLEGSPDDSFILYREVEGSDDAQEFPVISGNTVSFSASLENSDMEGWSSLPMVFQAYAIQKAGFDTAEAAWAQLRDGIPAVSEEAVTKGEDTNLTAKVGEDTYTATVPADSDLVLKDEAGTELTLSGDETLKLVVTPDDASANFLVNCVGSGESEVTYDVSLYVSENGGAYTAVASSSKPIKVSLDIGVVELHSFFHNETEYDTPVNSEAELTAVGQFYAKYVGDKVNVTFLTNSFSPFSAVIRFAGGIGTEAYPYLIDTKGHWVEMCEMNDWGENYPGQYYIYPSAEDEDYCYVQLINDIDLTDAVLPYSCTIYSLYLDGNNHTVSNLSGYACIFDNDSSYYYKDNVIKNLTVVNCEVESSIFGYGTYGEDTVTFNNVDLKNCSASGGAYFYYCKNGTVNFKDCDAVGTNVTGGSSMAVGGYVGNISNGYLNIEDCTFGGSVVSTNNACAGFVGQPKWGSDNISIKNSTILAGTVVKNLAGNSVSAFDGQNSSYNYAADGNKFLGTLVSNGTKSAQGTDAKTSAYEAPCTAADFTVNADGSVTYTGDAKLGKVVITSSVTNDMVWYGSLYGGYSRYIQSVSATDLSKGDSITGFTKVTDMKNVVSSAETPVGLQVLAADIPAAYIGNVVDGTYYFDARSGSWGYYMLAGTYNNGAAVEPTSLNVCYYIEVYDGTGALAARVGGGALAYAVDLGE